MVFPGRFSTGCKRCRKRKVKCDEKKPSCRRCYIYGKPCPGYTDQFHFRQGLPTESENNAAKNNPSTGTSLKTNNSRVIATQALENKQLASINRAQQGTIAPSLSIPPDQFSLSYFTSRFVSPGGMDNFPGHLNYLPQLFNPYGQGPLETATLSVAQMAAFNQIRDDSFRLQSYQNYGRAIRGLHEAIQTEEHAMDDRVIATVLLLCTFKDISGEGSGDPLEHVSGLHYLLEKRGVEQLWTRRGVELFVFGLLRLQAYSFIHEDDTYCDPGGIAGWFSSIDPLMRALHMMSRVLRLRHSLAKCATTAWGHEDASSSVNDDASPLSADQTSPSLSAQVASTIESCFESMEDFNDWDAEAPSYWTDTFEGRTAPGALGQIAATASYYDAETACTICLVRTARLILLLSMLDFHARGQMVTGGLYDRIDDGLLWSSILPTLQAEVSATIDDMLATVPFVFGDVDPSGGASTFTHDGAGGLVILQSMRLVTYCRYATPEQTSAAQNILSRINANIGVRSAIPWSEELANASQFATSKGLVGLTGTPPASHSGTSPRQQFSPP